MYWDVLDDKTNVFNYVHLVQKTYSLKFTHTTTTKSLSQ